MDTVMLTKENFDNEVLAEKNPVVIVFTREEDEACKAALEILEEYKKQDENSLKVCVLMVDEQPALALKFGILDVPALVFMRYGLFQERLITGISVPKIDLIVKAMI